MLVRAATLLIAAATAVLLAPSAHADPAQDQQYLELVRSNGVTGGQDPALIAFAQQ